MVRPHPAVWRVIHGMVVIYLLVLVFLLFQDVDDARQMMRVRPGLAAKADLQVLSACRVLATGPCRQAEQGRLHAKLACAHESQAVNSIVPCPPSKGVNWRHSNCTRSWGWTWRSARTAWTAACGCRGAA